ncbi:hypothetical protein FYJ43_06845 [Cutibacterium sp. WCA-380-WT-3A]|uniref:DUF222 domain-containing protein n=1 Tax=Cutibacterium porci TaxID=2605781 RepID=A0A7K0J751_9ACTN|nr:hypothetical protein [Cutibacterium porci]MSS45762.1 hypothetical protein [Cutibacterium porci]
MNEIDLDVKKFARILGKLEEHLEVSDAFEDAVVGQSERRWSSQREHMTSWFRGQRTTGSGAYTRNKPNHSAKRAYNRLQSPEGLLWIAEALGADTELVRAAADEALAAKPNQSRCAVIRRHLPWPMIAELATSRTRWRRR